MNYQNFESKSAAIRQAFRQLRLDRPERIKRRLDLSWSNWGFGLEDLSTGANRLRNAGIDFIELHGNLYGPDLGYRKNATIDILGDFGLTVSGVCGMFSVDNDLSSPTASHRQRAIDYIKRQVAFSAAVAGTYLLVVPGAVGRPVAYDSAELQRSAETLALVADLFIEHHIQAAIEPIRADEVSIVNSVQDAIDYIEMVDHPGVQHINGDVFHMQTSESHIGDAIINAGDRLVNLHLADSNRRALGSGSLDLDTVIRALYIIGHNVPGRYVTPEPLGQGAAPYTAMWGRSEPDVLDRLVHDSVSYFRERELAVLKDDE